MIDKPDYTNYSLDELYDAERHIDREQYPDRADQIAAEIRGRAADPSGVESALEQTRTPFQYTKRGLGLLIAATGGYSLVVILDHARTQATGSLAIYGLAGALFGGMIVSEVLLVRRWRFGLWLGVAVITPQVFLVQAGNLSYQVNAFPTFRVVIWPPVSLAISTETFVIATWHSEPQNVVLGLNLFAGVLLGVLLHYATQHRAALNRLSNSRTRAG